MNLKYRRPRSARRGLILLLVLSMLGLFSVLAVSYVVFTSRARTTSSRLAFGESVNYETQSTFLDTAQKVIIRDFPDSSNSASTHSILADYYGMRDSVTGFVRDSSNSGFNNALGITTAMPANVRQYPPADGHLFAYLNGQFVRVPTNLVDTGSWDNDDIAAGCYLTFTQGPLLGKTFEIVRSFGQHGTPADNADAASLRGAVILDLTPRFLEEVTVIDPSKGTSGESITQTIEDWATGPFLGALFYHYGADIKWGNGGSNMTLAGYPGSDDRGYAFHINGHRLNGFGMGVKVDATTQAVSMADTQDVRNIRGSGVNSGVNSYNSVATALQPHFSSYVANASSMPLGDADEPYDAPDEQNMWLGYFPVDDELGMTAPSFVRPALLNYLLNEPATDILSLPVPQQLQLIRLLQRATMRPYPTMNDPLAVSGAGPGVTQLNYGSFTGSNDQTAVALDFSLADNPANRNALGTAILQLVNTLVNGPWDVDNDLDGVPDSVWIDIGLPIVTMADGTETKPLVAYRIEDLGGRIDLNSAGSLAWYRNAGHVNASGGLARAALGGVPPSDPEKFQMNAFRGLGYGPADMPLVTMFFAGQNGAAPSGFYGIELLRTRYGKEMVTNPDLVPGVDNDPVTTALLGVPSANDIVGLLRDPYRKHSHTQMSPGNRGAPLDVFMRGKVVLDVFGQPMVSNLSTTFGDTATYVNPKTKTTVTINGQFSETENDPYEFVNYQNNSPDRPFTLSELDFLFRPTDSSSGIESRRLKELVQNEEESERTFHTGSGALQPESFYGLARQVTVLSNSDVAPVAVLPVQLRKSQGSNNEWSLDLARAHRLGPVRLYQRLFTPPASATTSEDKWVKYAQVVPPEIRLGRKFNLNRPIANGFDDDADGFIDESDEGTTSNEWMLVADPSFNTYTTQNKNVDYTMEAGSTGIGTPPKLNLSGNDARQLYARHVFCMMMFAAKDEVANKEFAMEPDAGGPPQPDDKELTHWKYAQFAVNAVDFRDPDSIMTGFEYDANPFDGWDVDGDLTTDESSSGVERGVVWGMEAPALLLTESFSGHDRRVRDTDLDDDLGKKRLPSGSKWADMNGDDDVDQYRVPMGWTFLELQCVRSPAPFVSPATLADDTRANPWGASNELYSVVGNALALDIGKVNPADGNPVWRIGISPAHNVDNPDVNAKDQSPLNLLSGQHGVTAIPDQFTGQPENLDFLGTPIAGYKFDRVVWFAQQDPKSVTNLPPDTVLERVYFNRTMANAKLIGGQFAVVGPRTDTFIGSNTNATPTALPYTDYVSKQELKLTANQFTITDLQGTGGNLVTPVYDDGSPDAKIRSIVGMVVAAERPSAAWDFDNGLNISEPTLDGTYYKTPTHKLNTDFPVKDGYYDFSVGGAKSIPDEPFDRRPGAPLYEDFKNGDGENTGTRENYKTAYLQRLADPTQAYHAQQNPYITVDWIPLDLTVYNGEDSNDEVTDTDGANEWIDPSDPDPFGGLEEKFGSRYKSGAVARRVDPLTSKGQNNNPFSFHTVPPVKTTPIVVVPPAVAPYFSIEVHHDLDANDPGADRTKHSTTLGYLNHSFGPRWTQVGGATPSTELRPYVGAPDGEKYPWVVWNDRPYVSPLELMLVPFSSPGRLTADCSTPSMLADIYDGTMPIPPNLGNAYDGSTPRNYRTDYRHLLNFFSADEDVTKSGNFHQILDWVDTPDPFDSANPVLLPQQFPGGFAGPSGANWPPSNAYQWNVEMPLEMFRAPFNTMPSRVRRGVVNLNTINGKRVYRELMAGMSTTTEYSFMPSNPKEGNGAFYDDFLISRRGYQNGGTVSTSYPYQLDPRLDPDYPSDIAGKFVPGSYADLAPVVRNTSSSGFVRSWPNTYDKDQLKRNSVEAGLLRPTPDVRGPYATVATAKDPAKPTPLFMRDDPVLPHQDRDRSAFHRYQGITRLANLTSDQSNVFAVWTTIGVFEYDKSTRRVSVEYGLDEGNNRRERSFMIIDRSIPVDFTPGQDTNTKDVIVVQRSMN